MVHNNTNEIFTCDGQTEFSKIRGYTHTIPQFSVLAIGKSKGAQKMGGGEAGKQSDLT